RGRGEVSAFTTPAINVRMMGYHTARAIFRAAVRMDVGAVICEIARSEIGYTEQRPAEYVAVITAAALREGFDHPIFIQGDHVQVNAKKYATDPGAELSAIKALIDEEIHAGFYNIDVDTSTLVDLSQKTLDEQQRVNFERAAELTQYIRQREPKGVTISVGAEIGEVGGKNSDGHESWWRGAARRHHREGAARPRGLEGALTGGALDVRARRRGSARRVHAAPRRLRQLPALRGGRNPPRHELPDHGVRS